MIRESGNGFSEKIISSTARNHLLRFLCASGLIIVMAAALNFVVDPLQLFRPARLFTAMYSPDSRMQDAGLIRSQDFDTVFMGTSLAIHFRQSDIDARRALGETGDDRIEFPGTELCACRGAGAPPEAGGLADGRLDFFRLPRDRPRW